MLTFGLQPCTSRIVDLYFKSCANCSYGWRLLSNPYTDYIKVSVYTFAKLCCSLMSFANSEHI